MASLLYRYFFRERYLTNCLRTRRYTEFVNQLHSNDVMTYIRYFNNDMLLDVYRALFRSERNLNNNNTIILSGLKTLLHQDLVESVIQIWYDIYTEQCHNDASPFYLYRSRCNLNLIAEFVSWRNLLQFIVERVDDLNTRQCTILCTEYWNSAFKPSVLIAPLDWYETPREQRKLSSILQWSRLIDIVSRKDGFRTISEYLSTVPRGYLYGYPDLGHLLTRNIIFLEENGIDALNLAFKLLPVIRLNLYYCPSLVAYILRNRLLDRLNDNSYDDMASFFNFMHLIQEDHNLNILMLLDDSIRIHLQSSFLRINKCMLFKLGLFFKDTDKIYSYNRVLLPPEILKHISTYFI